MTHLTDLSPLPGDPPVPQVCLCLRTFAPAILSKWNALPNVYPYYYHTELRDLPKTVP